MQVLVVAERHDLTMHKLQPLLSAGWFPRISVLELVFGEGEEEEETYDHEWAERASALVSLLKATGNSKDTLLTHTQPLILVRLHAMRVKFGQQTWRVLRLLAHVRPQLADPDQVVVVWS